jgi:hypothetical protein
MTAPSIGQDYELRSGVWVCSGRSGQVASPPLTRGRVGNVRSRSRTGLPAPVGRVINARVSSVGVVTPLPGFTRPSGIGYVTIESLLQGTETMPQLMVGTLDITTVMARMTTAKIITFPEGVFEVIDFNAVSSTFAIVIPKVCVGLWGSGPGRLGVTTAGDTTPGVGTVFKVKANTATKQSQQPAQGSGGTTPFRVLMHIGGLSDFSAGQFKVEGTPQSGILYHGFTSYNLNGVLTAQDILVTGCQGNNGAPPGETFSFEIHQPHTYDVRRIECDGRRFVGDVNNMAVGITTANVSSGILRHCNLHHMIASALVLYQAAGTFTFDCIIDNASNTAPSAFAGGINHERAGGNTHVRPVITNARSGAQVHTTHSNDSFAATYNGVSVNTADGTLTYVDPIWNSLATHTDGKLWLQSWHPYSNGCTMSGNAVYAGSSITRKLGNIPKIYTGGLDVLNGNGDPIGVDLSSAVDVSDTKLHYIHNFTGWNSSPNPTTHTTA